MTDNFVEPRRCNTCHWWSLSFYNSRTPVFSAKVAECKLNAPTINERGRGVWPLTEFSDYCGGHKSRKREGDD